MELQVIIQEYSDNLLIIVLLLKAKHFLKKDISQYITKNKRNSYYSEYYKLNNINNALNNKYCDINIMPVNNIKSIFQYSKFKK